MNPVSCRAELCTGESAGRWASDIVFRLCTLALPATEKCRLCPEFSFLTVQHILLVLLDKI